MSGFLFSLLCDPIEDINSLAYQLIRQPVGKLKPDLGSKVIIGTLPLSIVGHLQFLVDDIFDAFLLLVVFQYALQLVASSLVVVKGSACVESSNFGVRPLYYLYYQSIINSIIVSLAYLVFDLHQDAS